MIFLYLDISFDHDNVTHAKAAQGAYYDCLL